MWRGSFTWEVRVIDLRSKRVVADPNAAGSDFERGFVMEALALLVARAARGEEQALAELYRRSRPAVVRLVCAFAVLDSDEMEDVVQESFVRAFRGLPKLREQAAFSSWLLSIARNRARTRAQQKAQAHIVHDAIAREPEPQSVGPIPEALRLERDLDIVRALIAELPDGAEKRTVELFYVEGKLSAAELAVQLGVGKSAITMRLERFRSKVKRELLRRLLAGRME